MISKNKKELQPGQIVQWTSQAGGYEKTKSGCILALIPVNERLSNHLEDIPISRIKAQNHAIIERVLVAVPRKSGIEDYYAPRPGQLEVLELSKIEKVELGGPSRTTINSNEVLGGPPKVTGSIVYK